MGVFGSLFGWLKPRPGPASQYERMVAAAQTPEAVRQAITGLHLRKRQLQQDKRELVERQRVQRVKNAQQAARRARTKAREENRLWVRDPVFYAGLGEETPHAPAGLARLEKKRQQVEAEIAAVERWIIEQRTRQLMAPSSRPVPRA